MTFEIMEWTPTSAGPVGKSSPKAYPLLVLALGAMTTPGTALEEQSLRETGVMQYARFQTSSLGPKTSSQTIQSTSVAVLELRRLSGLTWQQLAQLLGVSRRSVHLWASGQSLNASNEDHLMRTLGALKQADCGSARANREMLMQDYGAGLPLDLLAEHSYEAFSKCVPQGKGRKTQNIKPLSQASRDARKPQRPDQLLGALQDPIHRDIASGRAARTNRNNG